MNALLAVGIACLIVGCGAGVRLGLSLARMAASCDSDEGDRAPPLGSAGTFSLVDVESPTDPSVWWRSCPVCQRPRT